MKTNFSWERPVRRVGTSLIVLHNTKLHVWLCHLQQLLTCRAKFHLVHLESFRSPFSKAFVSIDANLSRYVNCDYSQLNTFEKRMRHHRNQLSFDPLSEAVKKINFCGLKTSVTNHITHHSFQWMMEVSQV